MVLSSGLKEMEMNHDVRTLVFLLTFLNVELNLKQPSKPATLQPGTEMLKIRKIQYIYIWVTFQNQCQGDVPIPKKQWYAVLDRLGSTATLSIRFKI
jgi:hypothetical protein